MSTDIVGRRMLLGMGAGVGAMALAARRAEADVPFSSFAFAATGSPTARTMPDRLSEIKNVKDFGARGNGSTDDTAAIQAAVNWTSSAGRGTVHFPLGTYRITAPITFEPGNLNIAFRGEPGATILGNFGDFLLKRSVNSPISGIHSIETLRFQNPHPTGRGIAFHSCIAAKVTNCYITAWRGIETFNSQALTVDTCHLVCPAVSATSVGIMAGNATTVLNCDIIAYNHGIRHQNVGLTVLGGRYEVNTVGIMIGMDENGNNFQTSGFDISGLSMEANQTGIYVGAGAAGKISACSISGGVAMAYGLRLGSPQDVVVQGVSVGGPSYSGAAISIEGATRTTLTSCNVNVSSGTTWNVATGLASYQLINCNHLVTVAQLPTSATVGTVLGVTDASATTEGTTVAGGGSNDVAVVRTAGVWRII